MPTFATIAALLSAAVLLVAAPPALADPTASTRAGAVGVASPTDPVQRALVGGDRAASPAPEATRRERGVPFSGLDLAFLLAGGLGLLGLGLLVVFATRPVPVREPTPARVTPTPAPTPAVLRR